MCVEYSAFVHCIAMWQELVADFMSCRFSDIWIRVKDLEISQPRPPPPSGRYNPLPRVIFFESYSVSHGVHNFLGEQNYQQYCTE
jgi:hypothetical protein